MNLKGMQAPWGADTSPAKDRGSRAGARLGTDLRILYFGLAAVCARPMTWDTIRDLSGSPPHLTSGA
jgi:hypothetical protein